VKPQHVALALAREVGGATMVYRSKTDRVR
jgi:hypothetical protein